MQRHLCFLFDYPARLCCSGESLAETRLMLVAKRTLLAERGPGYASLSDMKAFGHSSLAGARFGVLCFAHPHRSHVRMNSSYCCRFRLADKLNSTS